jgi:hypothetical protein
VRSGSAEKEIAIDAIVNFWGDICAAFALQFSKPQLISLHVQDRPGA